MRTQDGVVSRRQVFELGGTDLEIERRLGRREWVRLHPGVYLDHTGKATWEQRAWAAVLARWPAALGGESALLAHGVRCVRANGARAETIHLVVPAQRTPDPVPGIRIERIKDFEANTQAHLRPPRLRLEAALLAVAATKDESGAVAVLADACQERRTTPSRLLETLAGMTRLRHRRLLLDILGDVASGVYSVLERRYLQDVERAHALPGAGRQRPAAVGSRSAYRDVEYADQLTVVELDGRLGHEWSADRWADLDRDLAAAEERMMTLRVGWRQVLAPCRLAGVVGRVLVSRGWSGTPVACSMGCPVANAEGCSG